MTKIDILNRVTRSIHTVGFQFKKHSPEILAVAGTVGVVTSAVMACKATTKLSAIMEETKEQVDQIHGYVEENGFTEQYSEEDSKKDLTIVYAQTGLKLVKLYAPAVILGALSITSMLASNNILRKRNLALAAAYATVDGSFKEYRGRVIERFGKELDRELKHNIKAQEIEEVITNEDGTETTIIKTVNVADPNANSDYARIWYEGNPGWTKNPEANLMYLRMQQNYANDLLKTRGHLFLNEVYDILGFNRTSAGQIVGWVYDEKDPIGDNFVDFGIYDIHDPNKIKFVNGDERSILLDFNVDGVIYDLMK